MKNSCLRQSREFSCTSCVCSLRVLSCFQPECCCSHNGLTAKTCAPATACNLESECVTMSIYNGSSPVESHVRAWKRSVVGTTMEELAQRLQQVKTQVGQQRAVIEHQQDQLMHQQTTTDADRAARTPVTQLPWNPEEVLVWSQSWKQARDVRG